MRILNCLLILMCFFECSCSKAPNPAPKFHNQAIANYSYGMGRHPNGWDGWKYQVFVTYELQAVVADPANSEEDLPSQFQFKFQLNAIEKFDPANPDSYLIENPFFYRSYKQAFKWCQKAATLGDSYAMGELGLMYYYGESTLLPLNESLLKRLGLMYYYSESTLLPLNKSLLKRLGLIGEGTLKDRKEAFKWFKKAAELGNSNAMGMLGVMYYYGMGTLKDPQQAKYWIKKAYEAGNNENAEKTWNTLELWKY